MDNTQEILKFFIKKGLLVDRDVLNLFKETEDVETAKILIENIGVQTQKKLITKNLFEENKDKVNQILLNLPEEKKKKVEKLKIQLGLSIHISKEISKEIVEEIKEEPTEQIDEDVKLVSAIPALSKKLEVQDFVKYFRRRFQEMRGYLQEHPQLDNLISINKILSTRQAISIIGIVYDKKTTKNKNILLEVEDLTGRIRVLVNQNKPELYEQAEEIPLDSVLGFKGVGDRNILFANEIIFPDSMLPEKKKSPVEEYALFIGDLHIGSKLFMENNFLKFVDYLNGKIPNTPEVEKIKYLFIVGDLVAGVGIYPGQENELSIPDVEAQYEKVAELLGKIRKEIKIILSPGNHDALRLMEPQPIFDEKYSWPLFDLKNVIMVGNPAQVNISAKKGFSGFDVLIYHGYSYHYYAGNIPRLIKEKAVHQPDKIMQYLLKFRHLAPTHSSTLYFPSETDYFIISKIPDIFFSGHTHKSAVSYYNNILVISSSTWESLTAFQERMGNEPDFCKVPMLNLKTRAVKILDFE